MADLSDQQRWQVEARWLQQFAYFEHEAEKNYARYVAARSSVIILSALIPGVVAARESVAAFASPDLLIAFIGVTITILGSLEAFLRMGEKARHYRTIAERLRLEGWQFIQLGGIRYQGFADHGKALQTFVRQTESIYVEDIEGFPWTGEHREPDEAKPSAA